jgi:hypothetical protein
MIIRIAKLGAALLAMVAVVGQADAQITKQGKGYLFRMKFAKGQTMKYVVDSKVQMPGTPQGKMEFSMPMVMTVKSVTNGVADIAAKVGPMSMNGKPGQTQTTNMKINSRGEVVGGQGGMQTANVPLPQGPVAIGATWNANIPLGAGAGGQTISAVYKFTGIKNIAGRQCAVLAVTLKGMGTGTGTTYISMADGSLVRSNMSMSMKGPNGQGMAMTASVIRK